MNRFMLAMTAGLYDELREYLFPDDGLEAAAIILCAQGKGRYNHRLIANEIIKLPYDRSERKSDFLSWPFAAHFPPKTIMNIDLRGLSIITIHSHPDGFNQFSKTDDDNDRELFPSVCSWFDDKRPNGAAIMLPDGKIHARTVNANGVFQEMESVAVVGKDICVWKNSSVPDNTTGYGKKLKQTFGSGTLKLLQSLRIGVVGCSGTGSVVIELLARNCIGELVIADNDYMESKNLNRIINGKMADVRKKRSKAFILKRAVEQMGMDTTVDAYVELTDSPDVIAALIDCDVIFGCVDSAFGRYHLECIANAYCIPYFDVGVNLEANNKGGIATADAVAHYMHPEGQSLFERGGYTMEQVRAEDHKRNTPEYYQEQHTAGYLREVGEEQPAVMSVNMQAACLAFNDFLARIHSFRLDGNENFSTQRFHIVHGCYEPTATPEQLTPSPFFARHVNTGDRSLLVKNNICRDKKKFLTGLTVANLLIGQSG